MGSECGTGLAGLHWCLAMPEDSWVRHLRWCGCHLMHTTIKVAWGIDCPGLREEAGETRPLWLWIR